MQHQRGDGQGEEYTHAWRGPRALTVSATHPLGPLAGWSSRARQFPALGFTLTNTGQSPRAGTLALDVLAREQDGSSVEASLSLVRDGPAPLLKDANTATIDLAPHAAIRLQLHVEGRLPPGRYVSCLRVHFAAGETPLVIPITLRVAAHWLWAVGCMVLGLMFLGLTGWLAGAADVQEQRARVLLQRQQWRAFLDRFPPAEAHAPMVADIEDALAEALEALGQARPWSMRDTRLALAEHHVTRAQEYFKTLRTTMDLKATGTVEVEYLTREWQRLHAHMQALVEQFTARQNRLDGDAQWQSLLHAVLHEQRRWFLEWPVRTIEVELGPHVQRVQVILASGEGLRAHRLAGDVRRWLRRAARLVEERVRLLLGWHIFAEEMLGRYALLAGNLTVPQLADEARNALGQQLTAAQQTLARDQSLIGFRDAYMGLQRAETFLVAAWSQVVIQAVRAAVEAAAAATSLTDIEAMTSRLSPDDPPEVKRHNFLHSLELWDKRVQTCQDETLRHDLQATIQDARQRVTAGDLVGALPGYQRLFEVWKTYTQAHIDTARQTALQPYCAALATGLRQELQTARELFQALAPHHTLAGVDAELDRLRLGLERIVAGTCLEALIGLHAGVLDVGAQLFVTLMTMQNLTPEARLAAAEHSETQAAIVLARRLMREPWPLRVVVQHEAAALYAGQQVFLAVEDLHPGWGAGITLAIDLGDGAAPLYKTAEALRQAPVVHRYTRPRHVTVKVVAGEHFPDGALQPTGEKLGEGRAHVDIQPSPVSGARRLAGIFLNVRFLIALVIGLVVQIWRFYGARSFGAQGSDYVEAFALGLGIDAGMRGLVDVLGAIGLPG